MAEHHELMGGKLHIYKRENSQPLAGFDISRRKEPAHEHQRRKPLAREGDRGGLVSRTAEAKPERGELTSGPTFKKAADQFLAEYETITQGQRSPNWVKAYEMMLRVYLLPYFGKMALSEITAGKVQEYRIHRQTTQRSTREGSHPSRTAPCITRSSRLRQVLKTAHRHGWLLRSLPDLWSRPYKTSGKITHRAWFSPEEYSSSTRRRAAGPKTT